MEQSDIKIIIFSVFLFLFVSLFVIQISRLWKIRVIINKFLFDLRKLNDNLDTVIRHIHGKSKSKNRPEKTRTICKFCLFRLTFVNPDSPKVFFYQCKLDDKKISLSDTCKKFQKDLLNTQI